MKKLCLCGFEIRHGVEESITKVVALFKYVVE